VSPDDLQLEPLGGSLAREPLLRRVGVGLGREVVPLLPFRFPTLTHLNERVADVQHRASSVEGLQPNTIGRWIVAWQSFHRFIRVADREQGFLEGDYRKQCRVIEDWVASLRERRVSRTTIATYWRSVQTQLKRIERDEGMMNPFSLLVPPKPAAALPRSLTRKEATRLVSYIRTCRWKNSLERSRNVCLIALLLLAGLRRGEALRLKLTDCNLERRTLTIRDAKGRNGGRTRTAYLPAQLATFIIEYIEERSQAEPPRTHPELLTALRADRPLSVPTVRNLFKRMRRDLDFKVTPHMLRHTYALLLRQSGVPDRVSMDFLGHRSLAMLQRYSHVFDAEYQGEAEKVVLDLDD
jgi:site-specific recombinase XerD